MIKGTYINLPVANVTKTRAYFTALGFAINEQFSNDQAVALTLGPSSAAMLLSAEFFKTFIPKPIADAHHTTEVLIALQLESKGAVDTMTNEAIALGGKYVREPQDHGFMYSRAFADIDGHTWEPFWMEEKSDEPQ
jgi:uncharacterized protein